MAELLARAMPRSMHLHGGPARPDQTVEEILARAWTAGRVG
ncbi:hypothetical protein ACFY2R_05185 [Micromonospora olivasterospora]|nr:hypothetical protein [Micromonospora olivasterospora]